MVTSAEGTKWVPGEDVNCKRIGRIEGRRRWLWFHGATCEPVWKDRGNGGGSAPKHGQLVRAPLPSPGGRAGGSWWPHSGGISRQESSSGGDLEPLSVFTLVLWTPRLTTKQPSSSAGLKVMRVSQEAIWP